MQLYFSTKKQTNKHRKAEWLPLKKLLGTEVVAWKRETAFLFS